MDSLEDMDEDHLLTTAIIGGGYAGMAAAVTLAENNIPVTVFESAKQLGGRARAVVQNATQLDNGQHILLGCYQQTLKLIEQVGGNIKQDFLRLPLQLTLHNRFELKAPRLPAPFHLLVGLLYTKGLSYQARLQAARFMLSMRRINFKLQADISALELLKTHRQDNDLIHLLWEPICISALNTPINKASAQVLLNVLRDSLNGSRADSDMLLPRLDFSALFPDRAEKYIDKRRGKVVRSCAVESITRHQNEFAIHTAHGMQYFDRVICATSPSSAIRLLSALPALAEVAQQIEAISYQPIYTVYLQYPAEVRLPHPMLGLDRCVSQWLFDRGQISGQAGLIAAVISAEGCHQAWSHEQLAQKVTAELRDQFGVSALPEWHQIIAEKRATFSCVANISRPAHITREKNLLLAGDFTAGDYPATLEGAVISGIRCAHEIIRQKQSW